MTTLHFGHLIRGDIGKPVDLDIRTLFNNTHVMVLAAPGNDVARKLSDIERMLRDKEGERVVGHCVFIRKKMERDVIHNQLVRLHEHAMSRIKRLEELRLVNWPVGQTIDGTRHTGTVLIVEDATALFNERWLVDINDPCDPKVKGVELQKLFVYWSRVFRALGILIILYVSKASPADGVPPALVDNCLLKQMFRVGDDYVASEFFNCSVNKFTISPTTFEPGVCAIKAPWISLDYSYAKIGG